MATNNAGDTPTGAANTVLQGQGVGSNPAFSTATYPASSGGTGKILFDNGTNFIESTPTFPASASATTRKIIVSDGTNWVASTETWAVPGTSGNILQSDGTNWTSVANTGAFSPNSVINLADDFMGAVTNSGINEINSNASWFTSGSTSNFLPVSTTSSAHPGLIGNKSMTSGANGMSLGNGAFQEIVLGGGALTVNWVIDVATLSTGTNTYTLYIGLLDNVTAAPANGVYFTYTNALNSGNWVGQTAKASATTSANSAVAVSAGTYVNLQVTVNAGATSCGFFVNGVQIANSPLATNIPTVAITPGIAMVWSAGTVAASSLLIDMFYMTQTLTSAR